MTIRPTCIGGAALLGALAVLAGIGVQAAPATPHPEASLLGVKLRSSFSDVLAKFGQPHEIQVGEPIVTNMANPGGATAGQGLPGFAGRGGGMGMPGAMMGGGMRGGISGMSGGGFPGAMMGGQGRPMGGPPGGLGFPPGMSAGGMGQGRPMGGPPGGLGMPNGMSYPGAMAGGGKDGGLPGFNPVGAGRAGALNNGQGGDNTETTWWYHFPKLGLHYSFLFNKQGRVIQIQAYGYKPSPKIAAPRTVGGITLGDSLGQVIHRYGWSNDGEHNGDYIVLRYGAPDQVAFQIKRNQVIGIVLGLVQN